MAQKSRPTAAYGVLTFDHRSPTSFEMVEHFMTYRLAWFGVWGFAGDMSKFLAALTLKPHAKPYGTL